ncbi:MAG: RNA polymerase sigma factor RpoD/SigA [Prolixibacteraceae bacterium]|nr:RNA polymerase sigma factor RpoD/SigA [Prolixibacteraceae bacterium]
MRQLSIARQVTNRESLSFNKYLQEIAKLDRISVEQEVELARRIKNGDMDALQILIKSNLKFVISVAKQYQNLGLRLPDLVNEGNLGLIKAAKRYDETRGFKFISFAVWWIRQAIIQALAERSRMVRLPLNKINAVTQIKKISVMLEQQYQRSPVPEEIASYLDTSPNFVYDSLMISKPILSADYTFSEQDGNIYDIIPNGESSPERSLMKTSLSKDLERVISTLGWFHADIIRYHFGLDGHRPHTIEELSEKFNLTRSRIRQIKESAIKKMRKEKCINVLKDHF